MKTFFKNSSWAIYALMSVLLYTVTMTALTGAPAVETQTSVTSSIIITVDELGGRPAQVYPSQTTHDGALSLILPDLSDVQSVRVRNGSSVIVFEHSGSLTSGQTLVLPALSPGQYVIEISTGSGDTYVSFTVTE